MVIKEDSRVTIEVLDTEMNTVSFMPVYDSSEIENAEEVILADVYKYIENQSDELDKIVAHFIK
ncbi:DUF1108 family protein [Staphylococcus pseudintermedius]|nr:DUF1108 family protein [Staphylococcus pseudintermedius]